MKGSDLLVKSPADLHGTSEILAITGKDEKNQPPDIIDQVHNPWFPLALFLPAAGIQPSRGGKWQLSRTSQILLVSLLLRINKLALLLLL